MKFSHVGFTYLLNSRFIVNTHNQRGNVNSYNQNDVSEREYDDRWTSFQGFDNVKRDYSIMSKLSREGEASLEGRENRLQSRRVSNLKSMLDSYLDNISHSL